MVKKLLKYEWISNRRFLIPISIAIVALAGMARLMEWLFESFEQTDVGNIIYMILSGLNSSLLVISLVALFGVSVVMVVIRFYNHLLGKPGYLSFSLPVTPGQHLWVKTLSAGLVLLWDVVLSVGALFLSNIFYVEDFYIGTDVPTHVVVALILYAVICLFFMPLLYYTCICIGQRMTRHRILGAFICYAVYYVIKQLLGIVGIVGFLIFISVLGETSFSWDTFSWLFWVLPAVTAGVGVGFFFLSKHQLTYKLNLE